MADIAQLPGAHAQNILPDMASSGHLTSGHVTDIISGEKAILRRILGELRCSGTVTVTLAAPSC